MCIRGNPQHGVLRKPPANRCSIEQPHSGNQHTGLPGPFAAGIDTSARQPRVATTIEQAMQAARGRRIPVSTGQLPPRVARTDVRGAPAVHSPVQPCQFPAAVADLQYERGVRPHLVTGFQVGNQGVPLKFFHVNPCIGNHASARPTEVLQPTHRCRTMPNGDTAGGRDT